MFGSAASLTVSTPSTPLRVQSSPPGWSAKKPSSPTLTRWCRSIDLMNVDTPPAQDTSVSVVHPADLGYLPDPTQRGSLPSSHVMIVGSSLYLTPVIEFVRLSTCAIQSWYQPRIVALV